MNGIVHIVIFIAKLSQRWKHKMRVEMGTQTGFKDNEIEGGFCECGRS